MGKKIVKIKRNSSIELLRIIMMLQIIYLHVCSYGNFEKYALEIGGKHEFLFWITWLMCRGPVFMFIIIMGYYLSESKSGISIKRILKVYIPIYIYAISIPFIVLITGVLEVNKYYIIKGFFPILSRTWYFMTLYLLVLILSPFINKLINSLSKKEYMILLGILFFIFSIWQPLASIKPFNAVFGIKKIIYTEGGKSLYDFIFMYILGGFLRRYRIREAGELSWWKNWMNLACYFLLGLINVGIVYIYPEIRKVIAYNDNLIAIFQCVFLFSFFVNMNFYSRTINVISGANLGIYMIHEHPLIRKLIWNKIFYFDKEFYMRKDFVIYILFAILSIYFMCFLIEFLRKKIYEFIKNNVAKREK